MIELPNLKPPKISGTFADFMKGMNSITINDFLPKRGDTAHFRRPPEPFTVGIDKGFGDEGIVIKKNSVWDLCKANLLEGPVKYKRLKARESDMINDHAMDSLHYSMRYGVNYQPSDIQQQFMDYLDKECFPRMLFHGGRRSGRTSITNMMVMNMAKYLKCGQDYEFTVPNPAMINWDEIAQEISRDNPILHVEVGTEKYVVVFRDIILKAETVGTAYPLHCAIQTRLENCTIFYLEKPSPEVKWVQSFDAWSRWARKIKKANWGQAKKETTIKVHIPLVK